ncbi:MAG: HD domain-containing phosphohydrolase [Candidatus Zixiibacteriota bacterium]
MSSHPPPITTAPSVDAEQRRRAHTVLKALFAAWRAAAVYDDNNAGYRSRRSELDEALADLFDHGSDCRISYQNDYLFFNGERLNYDREFSSGRPLAERFGELGLGDLTIHADASPDQIDQALFALAEAGRRPDRTFDALRETWTGLAITGITIGPLSLHGSRLPSSGATTTNSQEARRRRALALFQRSEAVVQDFWERVRDRNSFDSGSVQRTVHQLIDEVAGEEDILFEFAALKDFDEYTFYHSVNVAIYSIAVGMRLGLDRMALTRLGLAAMLHDIGKVKLPRDLITKPKEFDEDDWTQIKRHPALGALTIASMRPLDAQVSTAMAGAFEHHLNVDLSGYPTLTRPRVLQLESRIIALCDAFDAMTSGRVYQKEAISPDEAMRRLLHQGATRYDPLVVKAFVHTVGVFPVGTVGRLSDGSLAVVIRNDSTDLYAPVVLVIRDAHGVPVRTERRLAPQPDAPADERLHLMEILNPRDVGVNVADYIGVINPAEPDASNEALAGVAL